jgi:hypothetical protein
MKKYRWGWGRGAPIFDRMKSMGNGKSAHMGKGDMDMMGTTPSTGQMDAVASRILPGNFTAGTSRKVSKLYEHNA